MFKKLSVSLGFTQADDDDAQPTHTSSSTNTHHQQHTRTSTSTRKSKPGLNNKTQLLTNNNNNNALHNNNNNRNKYTTGTASSSSNASKANGVLLAPKVLAFKPWRQLSNNCIKNFPAPVRINGGRHVLFVSRCKEAHGVVIYDVVTDTYPASLKYTHPRHCRLWRHAIAFNKMRNLIYVFGGLHHPCFLTFKLDAHSVQKKHTNNPRNALQNTNVHTNQHTTRQPCILDPNTNTHTNTNTHSNTNTYARGGGRRTRRVRGHSQKIDNTHTNNNNSKHSQHRNRHSRRSTVRKQSAPPRTQKTKSPKKNPFTVHVNEKTSASVRQRLNAPNVGAYARVIYDAKYNKLHVIGGSKNNKHYVYNEYAGRFTFQYEWTGVESLYAFALVLDRVYNRLILVGGCSGDTYFAAVWFFNLQTNIWREARAPLALALPLASFAYVFVESLQLLLVLGGWTSAHQKSDAVFLLDLNAKRCVRAPPDVRCPRRSRSKNGAKGGETASSSMEFHALLLPAVLTEQDLRRHKHALNQHKFKNNLRRTHGTNASGSALATNPFSKQRELQLMQKSLYLPQLHLFGTGVERCHFVMDLFDVLPYEYHQPIRFEHDDGGGARAQTKNGVSASASASASDLEPILVPRKNVNPRESNNMRMNGGHGGKKRIDLHSCLTNDGHGHSHANDKGNGHGNGHTPAAMVVNASKNPFDIHFNNNANDNGSKKSQKNNMNARGRNHKKYWNTATTQNNQYLYYDDENANANASANANGLPPPPPPPQNGMDPMAMPVCLSTDDQLLLKQKQKMIEREEDEKEDAAPPANKQKRKSRKKQKRAEEEAQERERVRRLQTENELRLQNELLAKQQAIAREKEREKERRELEQQLQTQLEAKLAAERAAFEAARAEEIARYEAKIAGEREAELAQQRAQELARREEKEAELARQTQLQHEIEAQRRNTEAIQDAHRLKMDESQQLFQQTVSKMQEEMAEMTRLKKEMAEEKEHWIQEKQEFKARHEQLCLLNQQQQQQQQQQQNYSNSNHNINGYGYGYVSVSQSPPAFQSHPNASTSSSPSQSQSPNPNPNPNPKQESSAKASTSTISSASSSVMHSNNGQLFSNYKSSTKGGPDDHGDAGGAEEADGDADAEDEDEDAALSIPEKAFKAFFYSIMRSASADKYYQLFIDNEINDLEILMEFEKSDMNILINECEMNRLHAKKFLTKIEGLKEANREFQAWFAALKRSEYYRTIMVNENIFTFAMLYKRVETEAHFVALLRPGLSGGGQAHGHGHIGHCSEHDAKLLWTLLPRNNRARYTPGSSSNHGGGGGGHNNGGGSAGASVSVGAMGGNTQPEVMDGMLGMARSSSLGRVHSNHTSSAATVNHVLMTTVGASVACVGEEDS